MQSVLVRQVPLTRTALLSRLIITPSISSQNNSSSPRLCAVVAQATRARSSSFLFCSTPAEKSSPGRKAMGVLTKADKLHDVVDIQVPKTTTER